MVSFQCESCGDTLKKPKLDSHAQRCRQAVYTCIDCNVTFQGPAEYRVHTSCISEDQKYQKALYKPKKGDKPIPKPTPAVPSVPTPPIQQVASFPTPVASSNGVHPDRQRILGSLSSKRSREEPVVVAIKETVIAEVEEVVEEPAKKKSKKDKKEKKAAAAAAALAAESTATTTTSTPIEITPIIGLPTFLSTLLPTLLEKSISYAELKAIVLSKSVEAGHKDEALITKALEEGIKMGGKKLKIILSFE